MSEKNLISLEGKPQIDGELLKSCIHCGLCRFVCEDKVKPHNMGMWVRRSEGISRDNPALDQHAVPEDNDVSEKEWEYLLNGDPEERLEHAKHFREHGRIGA